MTRASGKRAHEPPLNEVTVNTNDFEGVPRARVRQGVLHALREADTHGAEISVTFVDDDAIRALSRDFLERDAVTDVIAFTLGELGEDLLGDVYIGCEQARRQAAELSLDPAEELVRLAIHGTLHVLGHDHPEGPERLESPMFTLQERLLREVLAAR